MDYGSLGKKSEFWPVLAVEAGEENVFVTHPLANVIESAVGILFNPPEPAQVVLPLVVVTVAKQANAHRYIIEQEAAEIGIKRLDADTNGVKIVAVADVA